MSSVIKSIINGVIFFLIVVVLYTIIYFIIGNELIIASPLKTAIEALKLLTDKGFYISLLFTLLRVIIAFLISFFLAIIFVLISKKSKVFSSFISLLVGGMRSLPTLAVLLLILVAVSRSFAPVIVCVLSLFPIFYKDIKSGIDRTENNLSNLLKVYKISKKDKVFKVYIPSMAKSIIKDASSGLSFSLKLIISAEILANVYKSVGALMQNSSVYMENAKLTALTLAVCLIGVLIEFIGEIFVARLGEY